MRKPGKGPVSDAPVPEGGRARERVAEFASQRGITLPKSLADPKQPSGEKGAAKKNPKRKRPKTD